MNALFAAIVVLCCLGCAWSAKYPCSFPNEAGTFDGVLDVEGKYKPGSVLYWVDIANNARQWTDAEGQIILDNWNYASYNFDKVRQTKSPNADVVVNSLRQAQISIALLASHINGNDAFAQVCTDVADSLKKELDNGNFGFISNFMRGKYQNFKDAICGTD